MPAHLSLQAASFSYAKLAVLHATDLELPTGSTMLVTGAIGSGKSTLLYLCAGLFRPTSGQVRLNDHNPTLLQPSEMFRHGVRRGVVFDSAGLLANLSALANVSLALEYHADVLELTPEQIERKARDALHRVGVSQADFHALPAHLSSRTRKCVSLARAIAIEPNFVFLDDPDTGLDRASTRLVHAVIDDYAAAPEVTLVIASNSQALLERFRGSARELTGGHLLVRQHTQIEGLR